MKLIFFNSLTINFRSEYYGIGVNYEVIMLYTYIDGTNFVAVILGLNILQIISLIVIGVVVLAGFGLAAVNVFRLFMPALQKLMRKLGGSIGMSVPGLEPQKVFESFDDIIKEAGFTYDKERDFFYSLLYPWQRRFGYTRLYDVVAPTLSMIIDSEPIRFEYNGYKWMIELWKGQYGMTTGCEIGVYTTKKPIIFLSTLSQAERDQELDDEERINRLLELATPAIHADDEDNGKKKKITDYIDLDELLDENTTFYYSADNDDLLFMSFVARKNGEILLAHRDRHWWLTAFKLGEFSDPSEITMSVSITLKDNEMLRAFLDAMYKLGYKPGDINVHNTTVQFLFDKPRSKQPYTRNRLTERIAQSRNKAFCDLYKELTAGATDMNEKLKLLYENNPELYKQALKLGKTKTLFTGLQD